MAVVGVVVAVKKGEEELAEVGENVAQRKRKMKVERR